MTTPSRPTIILMVVSLLLLVGGFIYQRPDKAIIAPAFDVECGCYCHKEHEKEMDKILKEIHKDRALLREERARESDKIMKDQEEYCSRPFRQFLEEYGKPSLPL